MIEGKDILLYIEEDSTFVEVACGRTCTLTLTSTFINITNPDVYEWTKRIPDIKNWSISGEGLIDLSKVASSPRLSEYIIEGQRVRIKFTVGSGTSFVIYDGYGYLTTITQTGNADDFATYSYQIIGDGKLTISQQLNLDDSDNKYTEIEGLEDGEGVFVVDENEDILQTNV